MHHSRTNAFSGALHAPYNSTLSDVVRRFRRQNHPPYITTLRISSHHRVPSAQSAECTRLQVLSYPQERFLTIHVQQNEPDDSNRRRSPDEFPRVRTGVADQSLHEHITDQAKIE